MTVELEERIEDHEERIHRLEDGQNDIRERITDLSDQVKEGNVRTDENNKYLRSQNTEVIRMLGGIQQKKQEKHIVSWQSTGKIAMAVSAVVGLITVVINLIFH